MSKKQAASDNSRPSDALHLFTPKDILSIRILMEKSLDLEKILRKALEMGASDVHIKAGIMPVLRQMGRLIPISTKARPLTTHEVDELAFGILDEKQKELYRQNKQIDLGWGISGLGRFRVNIFRQRGSTRMVIRLIQHDIPKIDELNLPDICKKIAHHERGLILVTGATGSGKSTTLASMLDYINRTRNRHILTIEDPIEYLIRDRKSIVSQREIGADASNFTEALRSALRQDPDIILIGEMRDQETIEIAMTAAETGHLVLSTLHTSDATETISRILSAFPPHQHDSIRFKLASVLKSVISQRLVRRADEKGFVPAVEVLMNTPRVAEMIEDPTRTNEINDVIENGGNWGMQSFDQCLLDLVKRKVVTYEHAMEVSTTPEDLALRHSGVSASNDQEKYKMSTSPSDDDDEGEDITELKQWDNIEELELERTSDRRKRRSS